MINITSGATNSFTLRFSDNITIDNPIYVFEFHCIQSGEKKYFTAADNSSVTRYNSFQVYEITGTSESEALTASVPKIELEYGGYYNYKVYQSPTYSLTASSVVLDSGKMVFSNGEYQSFFFELDYEYEVFDEYNEYAEFNFEDYTIYKIFDPEFATVSYNILTTETDDVLMTEENDIILY